MNVLITALVQDEVCGSLKDVYPVSQSAHHTRGIEYCVETLSDAYQMLCPGFHVSDRRAEWHRNTAFRRKAEQGWSLLMQRAPLLAEQGWSLLMQRAPLLAHSLSVHLTVAPCFEGRGESLALWGKDNSDDWGGGQSYPTMPAISSALAPGQRERKMLSLSPLSHPEKTHFLVQAGGPAPIFVLHL